MVTTSFFMPGYTPPTAFYFILKFSGFNVYNLLDTSFQEVSGLKATIDTVEKREGGENNFVHFLPNPPKYENLVLKRCLMFNSDLNKWCRDAIEDFKFAPKDINIALLGANSIILASWSVMGAFPISWELSTLNSTSNELAIETLTLKYKHFKKDI